MGCLAAALIPAERFFAMLGAVDEAEALEAALTLTARGVGLDVSRVPRGGHGRRRAAGPGGGLARQGALPRGLWAGDPLRLHWQDLSGLPQLSREEAGSWPGRARFNPADGGRLLWLVLEEAPDFAGQGGFCCWT